MKSKSDPASTRSADFRLGEVLEEHTRREGGFSPLARAISRSNGIARSAGDEQAKDAIDRRKLKSLVEGDENVVLSITDLRAIDRYLEPYGKGLAYVPLFQKPDLMQTLADSGRVTFLLGSKPEPQRWYFSHWDVLAMAEIQRAISGSEVSVRFDIQDVQLPLDEKGAIQAMRGGRWKELLDDRGPSLVCVGSSRTIPAGEAMLSRMFQVPYYKEGPLADGQGLPFHFVWNETFEHIFGSHFRRSANDVAADHPEGSELIRTGKASAIAIGERVYVDCVADLQLGDTYGICVAQRRKHGQVWLLLAGVTGAATFVAAKLAKHFATRLHDEKRGQDSGVHWAVIKAHIDANPAIPLGSLREFADESFIEGPHVWHPSST